MNESPTDVWFFSREGHQSGPITFAELREKADEGALRPRHDLAWTAGMPEWRPVGEIEGLFEKRVPTTVSEPIAAEPLVASPDAWPAHEAEQGGEWPGARRRSYLIALFVFPFLWSFLVATGIPLLQSNIGRTLSENTVTIINILPGVVAFWYSLQRFANLGMSRFWILGNLVPILNIWLGYRSFACPAGYAHHKKMDGVGIFLAIIYWLVVAAVIACLIVSILLTMGIIGGPEMQDKMNHLLEQMRAKAEVLVK